MAKKSYRQRNRGGDEEPKKPEQILEEIKKEEPIRLRDEHGRFTPKEPILSRPIEEPPAPVVPQENNPPPEQNSWFSPKEEPPLPPPEQVPPPREDNGWFSPKKEVPPPSREDNGWFSPKKEVPQELPPSIEEEPILEEKPSIFTKGFIIALVCTLFPLVLLSIGIYILARKPLYPSETTGTVKTAKCVNNNCILVIEFTPEGATDKLTSNELQISGNYNKGDSVKINYNPDNPTTFGVNLTSPKVFGWSFIGISIFLLLVIWAIYYFTR